VRDPRLRSPISFADAESDDSMPVTSSSTAATPELIHGDWVLFHPVYEPGEVDAVEVSDA
jgi:hypothetical protein